MTRNHAYILAVVFAIYIAAYAPASANQDTTYTPQEKAALEKFREAVKDITYADYQTKDAYLIHWLRARNLDVNRAKEMLAKSLAWRKQNKVDTIDTEKEMLKLKKPLPVITTAVDRENRPVLQASFGSWDIRKFMLAGNRDLLARYQTFSYEEITRKIREAAASGKDVSQWIFLVDMNNYSLRQHACLACIPFYLDLVNNYEANYPNTARHILLINTPRIFEAVLQLIRPLMSEATRRDMQVFGNNKVEWQAVLLSIIPPEELPASYGGTKAA